MELQGLLVLAVAVFIYYMLLVLIQNMFAVISWNSKNGVTLDREELEVQSSAKYVVMNGGKQEVGAAVSMLFRKDIWGGVIQSIHGKGINYIQVAIASTDWN